MASNVIIDFDDNRIFHASEWIGVGKNYPTGNSKPYIEDTKRQVLSVPEQFQHYSPPPELPVAQFVACTLPEISNEIISVKPATWFSHENPTTDPHIQM